MSGRLSEVLWPVFEPENSETTLRCRQCPTLALIHPIRSIKNLLCYDKSDDWQIFAVYLVNTPTCRIEGCTVYGCDPKLVGSPDGAQDVGCIAAQQKLAISIEEHLGHAMDAPTTGWEWGYWDS